MAAKRGSKLNKSESVQVRFDPKLKWAIERLAGRERRTLSSMVEWAMERTAKEMTVTTKDDGQPITAWQVADECWGEGPAEVISNLALNFPELLSYTERRISKILSNLLYFEGITSGSEMSDRIIPVFHSIANMIWPYIMSCAEGEIEQSALNKFYQEARIKFLFKVHRSGSKELRELADDGTLDQYPEAKKLVLDIVGKL